MWPLCQAYLPVIRLLSLTLQQYIPLGIQIEYWLIQRLCGADNTASILIQHPVSSVV